MFNMMESLDPRKLSEKIFDSEGATNCLIPMGITSENVCEKYGLKREDLDKFAAHSHNKAEKAQKAGTRNKAEKAQHFVSRK